MLVEFEFSSSSVLLFALFVDEPESDDMDDAFATVPNATAGITPFGALGLSLNHNTVGLAADD